jgi:hypothetical protein
MATFYVEGKLNLTILGDDFGISHVTKNAYVHVCFLIWNYAHFQR